MPRALIVDDNEENLYLLTVLLKGHGYEVEAAQNGNSALELARANPPNIAISDILMPGMDGFTLCREWREDATLAPIPFVFYTATYTDEKDEELALNLGADRFLLKPLDPLVLLSSIEDVLKHGRAAQLTGTVQAAQPDILVREYNAVLIRKLEDKLVELESIRRELARNEELLHCTLNSLPSLVVLLGAAGEIAKVNQPAGQSLSPDCSLVARMRIGLQYLDVCRNFLDPGSVEALEQGVGTTLNGRSLDFSCEVSCRDMGEVHWYSICVLPLRSHDGQAIVTHSDITSQRRAEERSAALERQLQAGSKMEAQGRLAGGIAHEFNNLLTVINGYTLRLLSLSLDEQQIKPLEQIQTAGARAAALTGQMLAFSSNQMASPRALDLNSIVTEMVAMLEPMVGENVRITTSLASQLGSVVVDLNQMSQVIMNLGANARDAMPNGGTLLLETRNEDVPESGLEGHPEVPPGPYAVLTVTDSGTGIDAQTMQSIFEPFFTTKQRGRGTGLGLAAVHGIVRQNGGWIDVESVVGKGSSFHVYLPRVNVHPEARLHPVRESAASNGQGTILVVEDQEQIRDLVVHVLTDLGYHPFAAADGVAALKLAHEVGKFDLVITDVVLPNMSGPEMVGRLSAGQPDLKVLYMSGYPKDLVVTGGLLQPGLVYLQKPFSPGDLAAKVEAVLSGR